MPKLTANTVIPHPQTGEPVLLAESGDLPDWAVGLVGDHLLDHAGDTPATAGQEKADDADDEADQPKATEVDETTKPKGTGPAQPGRTTKQAGKPTE